MDANLSREQSYCYCYCGYCWCCAAATATAIASTAIATARATATATTGTSAELLTVLSVFLDISAKRAWSKSADLSIDSTTAG